MKGGQSGCRGFLIYESSWPAPNAVYGYYEGENIVLKEGARSEMICLLKDHDAQCKKEEEGPNYGVLLLAGGLLGVSVLIWIFFGFMNFLGALVFSVLAYMPVLVIWQTRRSSYRTEELHEKFRRYHGCEHAAVKLFDREKELTLQNLSASPIYDAECGTVYSGYLLLVAAVLGLMISEIVNLGFLMSVGVLLALILLLFANLFNPWNPFKRLQYPAVAQPGEREYALGLEILRRMEELEEFHTL